MHFLTLIASPTTSAPTVQCGDANIQKVNKGEKNVLPLRRVRRIMCFSKNVSFEECVFSSDPAVSSSIFVVNERGREFD